MGEVYRARDAKLGREVAIKVLPSEVSSSGERRARFEREARAASALNHPNIVTIHDCGSAGPNFYIVMERVDGRTLRDMLAAGPLPVKRIVEIAAQLADGLAKAHAADIVHRDLKPENVMVTTDGFVKILDFGLAKLLPQDPQDVSREAPTGTQPALATDAGVVLGTVGYMSPEQASGRSVDFRSDQFALGAILYEMATGKRAFRRNTAVETLSAIINGEPPPVASFNPGVPVELRRITERCLAKAAEDRYASTRDLARDLRDARDQLAEAAGSLRRASGSAATVPADGSAARTSRRWPLLLSGAAIVVLALAAGSVILERRSRGRPAPREAQASIAVLPFQTFGGTADEEYFSDGMTESIITDLAKAKGLLVIARNSVFQYKGKTVDVPTVGRELSVAYVLEGSVQRSAGRVRVNAQLIDVATGFHRWAERYDREMKDVFDVQDDISKNIVAALAQSLQPAAAHPRLAPTANLEAYDLYLQGLSVFRRAGSRQNLEEAIALFERAVAADPQFALARARLAASYQSMSYTYDPRREWDAKGHAEVQKALALDPNLAEAHYARGLLGWAPLQGFQFEAAAADFRRAIEISPSLADAHYQLAWVYNHAGLLDRALEEAKTTARLDPGSLDSGTYLKGALLAMTYLYQHDYRKALGVYEKDPTTAAPESIRIPALIYLGRTAEARALLDKLLQENKWLQEGRRDPAMAVALDALLLAREGEGRKAEEAIAKAKHLCEGFGDAHHAQHVIASAYALLGKNREALVWLEKAADNGLPCYPYFEKDAHLDSLRGEPDYQAFMNRLKARWEHYQATL